MHRREDTTLRERWMSIFLTWLSLLLSLSLSVWPTRIYRKEDLVPISGSYRLLDLGRIDGDNAFRKDVHFQHVKQSKTRRDELLASARAERT